MAATNTGDNTLSSICLNIILIWLKPCSLAAVIYSLFLTLITSALTNLATPIQPVTPITTITFTIDGFKKAITAKIRKNDGKQSIISVNRIITLSTILP